MSPQSPMSLTNNPRLNQPRAKRMRSTRGMCTTKTAPTSIRTPKGFLAGTLHTHSSFERFLRDPKNKEQVRKLQEMAPLYQKHAFWDTQPVVHLVADKPGEKQGVIETKELKDVRTTPFTLPEGFEWVAMDIMNDKEAEEVFELLKENYVESTDSTLRLKYSIPFLRWALTVPEYKKDWILGCRIAKNKKLIGFIAGIPAVIVADKEKKPMAEVNFLCVHKKLRAKRLAPVLIKELTRRVNMNSVWQAVYTASKFLPTPFCETKYYIRFMNVRKLIDINYCEIPPKMTLKRFEKLNKVQDVVEVPGFRRMAKKDAKQVCELLNNFLKKFRVSQEFTKAEVKHLLQPKEGVVDCYVVEESGEKKEITDFVSFYTLTSSVLNHEKHKEMKSAYLYYYAVTKTPLPQLLKAALTVAKQSDHDVFKCLDVMAVSYTHLTLPTICSV
eukprot:TRINITY_DN4245_c0_g2_i24.p1 TRINITY_DN4245_c0_g2~~TRINITY_DN4245_c0_g2_i24.p1  ORF type:complete len:442 (+),score=130.28 TRINITY_DN4245_c0_g2_i24:207-1532(+)